MGDVHASAGETGFGGRQMMFFSDEPGLGWIGKITKRGAKCGQPVPPFAQG